LSEVALGNDGFDDSARQQRASDNDRQSLAEIGDDHCAELHEISIAWATLPLHIRTTVLALIRAFFSGS
jgi:hypothetical protein